MFEVVLSFFDISTDKTDCLTSLCVCTRHGVIIGNGHNYSFNGASYNEGYTRMHVSIND